MVTAMAFALTAGLGALARFHLAERLNRHAAIPVGTLVANTSAALAAGTLAGLAGPMATVVVIGGLGTLSTFSTLTAELVVLPRRKATLYLALTLVLGLTAAGIGLQASGGASE